jgi:hypothetical protein
MSRSIIYYLHAGKSCPQSHIATISVNSLISVIFCACGVIAGIITWTLALKESDITDIGDMLRLGFGSVSSFAIDSFKGLVEPKLTTTTLLPNILFANTPQVFLSVVVLLYSNLLHAIYVAREWDCFAHRPQALRVDAPTGEQDGMWLLGLPWKIGVFTMILQTLIHWFISLSVFPVQISVHASEPAWSSDREIVGYGYSIGPLYCTLLSTLVIIGSVYVIGNRKFTPNGPPVVSSCSAAISAACHVGPDFKTEYVTKKLRWGAVREANQSFATNVDEVRNHAGHCSFVTEEMWEAGAAEKPIDGRRYE